MEEISAEIGAAREDIVLAMESAAEVESLHKTIYQGDGSAILLMDRLEERRNPNEELLNSMLLRGLLEGLPETERTLICLRYFEEKTQTEVAERLGISQVQVSRYEKKILRKLRARAV